MVMFIGGVIAAQQAATSAALLSNKKRQDYQRGRHAAQLGEPFDREQSIEWKQGYINEIYYPIPKGGLVPQDKTNS